METDLLGLSVGLKIWKIISNMVIKDKESRQTESESAANSQYECNICLDTAKDAVISMCGHLFCWPCLFQWLETRPNNQTCPVCKSAISRDKVVPLYGRNCTDKKDPRDKVPPRPQGTNLVTHFNSQSVFHFITYSSFEGQRTEAPRNNVSFCLFLNIKDPDQSQCLQLKQRKRAKFAISQNVINNELYL